MLVRPSRSVAGGRPGNISALDGLRGLAILAVLFHHLFVFEPVGRGGARLASIAEFAGHGVDLFFALSGYLIIGQFAARVARPGFFEDFWTKRCAKIVPIYWIAIAGAFGGLKYVFAALGCTGKLEWLAAGAAKWPWYLLFGSNLLNAIDGRFTNPSLDVAWSLGIEVQFYLLASLAALTVPQKYWVRLAGVAIGGAWLFRAGILLVGANWIQILVLTPGRLDAFAFGGLVALVPGIFSRCPLWPVGALVCVPFFLEWSRARLTCELLGYSAVAAASALMIDRASRPNAAGIFQRALESSPLRFMGKISYSVYLTHLPVRAALRDWVLGPVRLLSSASDWGRQFAFTIGAGMVCIAVGWMVWRWLEEPLRLAILNLRPKIRAVQTGAQP